MGFWPEGRSGAIALTFDDGMESQRTTAAAILEERGLRGTFYLNPRGTEDDPRRNLPWRAALERWRTIHEAGHEIGNHSIRHPCSLNINIDWGPNSLTMTLEQIAADVEEAQRRIDATFPEQRATSFAYPCYESTVGRGAARVSYTPVVARLCVAARARGDLRGAMANDPQHCDLHHLSSWAAERQPGSFLVGLAEQASALGRWGIFTFHGVDEGHLPIAAGDLAELCDYLARRPDIWVAPVAEIAAYCAARAG